MTLESLGLIFGIVATVCGAIMSAGTMYLRAFFKAQLADAKTDIIKCVETRANELNDLRFASIERGIEELEEA